MLVDPWKQLTFQAFQRGDLPKSELLKDFSPLMSEPPLNESGETSAQIEFADGPILGSYSAGENDGLSFVDAKERLLGSLGT